MGSKRKLVKLRSTSILIRKPRNNCEWMVLYGQLSPISHVTRKLSSFFLFVLFLLFLFFHHLDQLRAEKNGRKLHPSRQTFRCILAKQNRETPLAPQPARQFFIPLLTFLLNAKRRRKWEKNKMKKTNKKWAVILHCMTSSPYITGLRKAIFQQQKLK